MFAIEHCSLWLRRLAWRSVVLACLGLLGCSPGGGAADAAGATPSVTTPTPSKPDALASTIAKLERQSGNVGRYFGV